MAWYRWWVKRNISIEQLWNWSWSHVHCTNSWCSNIFHPASCSWFRYYNLWKCIISSIKIHI